LIAADALQRGNSVLKQRGPLRYVMDTELVAPSDEQGHTTRTDGFGGHKDVIPRSAP
jgi:hypothetical protein